MESANKTTELNAALSNPRDDIAKLDELEKKLFALKYAANEIGSLGPCLDPKKAGEERGETLAILGEQIQEILCDSSVGALLDRLHENRALLDETHRAQVKILRRDRSELVDVPTELQSNFVRLTTESNEIWEKAKEAKDWSLFAPNLDKLIELRKEMCQARDASKDPYDVLLNDFEYGTNRKFYNSFFNTIKETVVPLVADCMASKRQPSTKPLEGNFDTRRQWDLAKDIVKLQGIDEDAFWLGKTEHPYTSGFGIHFVMVASHTYEENILSNVYSMLHENGHALYEQGVNWDYRFTSLKGGTSMGMHESQSRFFENYVGLSEAFAEPLIQLMKKHFPGQLNRVTAFQLFSAANKVQPSLIRTEADELTYPLHILIRYEMEQALLSGEITAQDVPALWAQKYKQYLGVTVPNDAEGALQDVHWSWGEFGYFPTYALGSAFGAQFKHAMIQDGIDFDTVCASGNLTPIKDWLGSHIWIWGRAKDSNELILNACGEPFDTHYYTDYLVDKYSRIYGLEHL
ncbi:MAG: carboxypeptidase M32 [Atopobiaceae bacterium]|nr:carboxypeptidase M32 [Atopobiaceae bacterium]